MTDLSHLKDLGFSAVTAQPKFRRRTVFYFAFCLVILGIVSYAKPQPYRAAYGSLAAAAAVFLVIQYRRERTLVQSRLSAIACVTDYQVRGRGVPHFGKGVPVIKYEFVAFDQKHYHGETGWGAQGLKKGSQLTILYNPENPTTSQPLRGFIFYSFR